MVRIKSESKKLATNEMKTPLIGRCELEMSRKALDLLRYDNGLKNCPACRKRGGEICEKSSRINRYS